MIFYKKQTKECWFHTNRSCKFEKNCFNEHKMRCMDLVITGKCHNKDCKRGHPMICRNIGKGRKGKERKGEVRQGKARQGKARQGKARQGKERKRNERKGKESKRKGKERQG